jgi:mxaJ protein
MIPLVSRTGRALCASAALVLPLFGGAPVHAQGTDPLRVCADPNYMPFSNSSGAGFENKIAEAVGRDLGRPVTFYWASMRGDEEFGQYLAETLKAHKCDLLVDVPYALVDAKTTKPYYISSYVFIYKKSKGYDLTSLDSPVLKRVKIGYEADTPVEDGLKLRGLTPGQKPFMTADLADRQPSAIVDAVEDGSIDVGMSWDPAVAYYAARHPDLQITVVPNSRTTGSPEQYTFPMSMATRTDDSTLNRELNSVIVNHRADLESVLRSYHIRFFEPGTGG